jgi:hypothetical protein
VRALDSLRQKQMAHQSAEGVRAAKYCHNLEGLLRLDPEDLAILAELLLRGPQTVGELRNRAERMCPVGDLTTVEELLQNLMERDEPLVMRLPRQPGRKEHRFAHLLAGTPEIDETSVLPTDPARLRVTAENDRIAKLENQVAALRAELDEMHSQLKAFQAQFE